MQYDYEKVNKEIAFNIKTYPEWRKGQAVYNGAHFIYPEIVNKICGTGWDCYYDNTKIGVFFHHLQFEVEQSLNQRESMKQKQRRQNDRQLTFTYIQNE